MKRIISLLLALLCAAGAVSAACAETGYETIYGIFTDPEVLGQPYMIRTEEPAQDIPAVDAEEETVKVCFAVFLFWPDNDVTQVFLIGNDEGDVGRNVEWRTAYLDGLDVMADLCGRFEELRGAIAEDVDFCISYSFDGGVSMFNIDTAEAARAMAPEEEPEEGEAAPAEGEAAPEEAEEAPAGGE